MDDIAAHAALWTARSIVIDCCIKLGRPELHEVITVEWNARLATTMGKAWTYFRERKGVIHLNPTLWARATEGQRRDTTVHEAAHILANLINGRKCGHGPLWADVMVRLGAPPVRCHNVSTEGVRRKSVRYSIACPRCGTRIRFNPQQRAQVQTGTGPSRYHAACGYYFTREDALRMEAV